MRLPVPPKHPVAAPFRRSLGAVSNRLLACSLLALAFGWGEAAAGPMGVFFTEETSRRELFPDLQGLALDTLALDSATAAKAAALIKLPVPEKAAVFERILSKNGVAGYIYRGSELGKVEKMDFAVALDAEGQVRRVLLTAYRESIGGEVKSRRFMRQFEGKKYGSPLQLGRDVDGITGATLSSRAVTAGVRKAVCFWKLKYGKA